MKRQVLFIQGGGEGTHDEWDNKLVDSLRHELGTEFEVRYPRMPAEDDPSGATWGQAIVRELETLKDGAIVLGHSVGATILLHVLIEEAPQTKLDAIFLLSAPFVGSGGWAATEFELPTDTGARLPRRAAIHVFHGLDDDTVPSEHAQLYARAIPQARVHMLPGRDHQLGNSLEEVAKVIREL